MSGKFPMVEINNLTSIRIDKSFLGKVANKVLIGENKKKLELSVILLGRDAIRKLNKEYRKKDKPTDVLSFAYDDSGEVAICPAEVKNNSEKFGSSFKKELERVLVHGILHLLGYDHEKGESGARKMRTKEERYSS